MIMPTRMTSASLLTFHSLPLNTNSAAAANCPPLEAMTNTLNASV